jgi:aminomethyltransferase
MRYTALNKNHHQAGARMVEFAGYEMPMQYKEGMLKEHEWVRQGQVGIFDVSHMGQILIEGNKVAEFLSYITPTDFKLSTDGLAKYTVLTNQEGGIIDDLIITKINDHKFFVVVNAGCKEKDIIWIKKNLPDNLKLTELTNRSLIAIQGAKSQAVLQNFLQDNVSLDDLAYMHMKYYSLKNNQEVYISRTGYTGEDGFEISIENSASLEFWQELNNFEEVKPIGLGARNSLRLEMGYPLYGHDLDETTSPIEAGLSWVVSKTNQNFIGSARILAEKSAGIDKKRLGVKILDRAIAREGAEVIASDGKKIGVLTSGGFSPSLKTSIGQGYIEASYAIVGKEVSVLVRGNNILAVLHATGFIAAKTKKNNQT